MFSGTGPRFDLHRAVTDTVPKQFADCHYFVDRSFDPDALMLSSVGLYILQLVLWGASVTER